MAAKDFPNPNEGKVYAEEALQTIYLAGGCFWGTQAFMRRVLGVADTLCGYVNGKVANPSYEQVCDGNTGHKEAVQVKYDPAVLPLNTLLTEFFKTINPVQANGQGNDSGSQYQAAIIYTDTRDVPEIEAFLGEVQKTYTRSLTVQSEPYSCFYEAEKYHQDYLEKNPNGYCHVDLGKLAK